MSSDLGNRLRKYAAEMKVAGDRPRSRAVLRMRAWNPDGLLSYDSLWPGAEKMELFLQNGVIYHGLIEREDGSTHAGPVALWQGEPRWQTEFEQMRCRILGELYFTPRTPDRGVNGW